MKLTTAITALAFPTPTAPSIAQDIPVFEKASALGRTYQYWRHTRGKQNTFSPCGKLSEISTGRMFDLDSEFDVQHGSIETSSAESNARYTAMVGMMNVLNGKLHMSTLCEQLALDMKLLGLGELTKP